MEISRLIDSLSPNERKILPYLDRSLEEMKIKSKLDETSVIRSLQYLKNKGVIALGLEKEKIVDLGVNGVLYKRKGLPERRLLNLLDKKRVVWFHDARKQTDLSDDEFKAAIGVLKKRGIIGIKKRKIQLVLKKEEVAKKTFEESFLEKLPIRLDALSREEKNILNNLRLRKNILHINEKTNFIIKPTTLWKKLISSNFDSKNLIEGITPELLKKDTSWKGKRFRRYDVTSPLPEIFGGKRHFVNQAADYARRVWAEMGFVEMTGSLLQTSFWNFDALFTAQDHPVREMQDTFFLDFLGKLPDKKVVSAVKKSHEVGVGKSTGWGGKWGEKEAGKMVLRTHTTCLSAKTLYALKKEILPKKFFAIGKCFRNETIDWSHGFEFNQTEGIVVDENANFRHLLGYLKEFYKKMGFDKIRFRPFYFPYTEPSVEIDGWNEEKKTWVELGGAGIFRPEVTIPLLERNIPVLAWGPGFDRLLMNYFQIRDLRDFYKNDLNKLRKMKIWLK